MYIVNGVAYAHSTTDMLEVTDVKTLEDFMMLVTFASGEIRLYDATVLFDYPVFEVLKDTQVFENAKVEDGVVTWCNGEVDIAPETVYRDSFKYDSKMYYKELTP